jgi:hypothetical protein
LESEGDLPELELKSVPRPAYELGDLPKVRAELQMKRYKFSIRFYCLLYLRSSYGVANIWMEPGSPLADTFSKFPVRSGEPAILKAAQESASSICC